MSMGKCSKCGSSDWKEARHVRARGITATTVAELNIITCKKCGFTEFYELTEKELEPIKKNENKIWIFVMVIPILIGIAVPAWLVFG